MNIDDQETRMIRRGQPASINLPPLPSEYDDDDATQANLPPAPGSQQKTNSILNDLPTANIPSSGQVIRPIPLSRNNDDQPTQFVHPSMITPGSVSADCEKTILVRPSSQPKTSPEEVVSPAPTPIVDKMNDPVVGWVVVTEGEGKGNSLCIGLGQNTLGRDTSNRIICNFGDKTISRSKHLSISFDQRSKKFFAVPGDSSNMSYLNDNVILTPLELHAYDKIRLTGETVLTFIPFCGETFSW